MYDNIYKVSKKTTQKWIKMVRFPFNIISLTKLNDPAIWPVRIRAVCVGKALSSTIYISLYRTVRMRKHKSYGIPALAQRVFAPQPDRDRLGRWYSAIPFGTLAILSFLPVALLQKPGP